MASLVWVLTSGSPPLCPRLCSAMTDYTGGIQQRTVGVLLKEENEPSSSSLWAHFDLLQSRSLSHHKQEVFLANKQDVFSDKQDVFYKTSSTATIYLLHQQDVFSDKEDVFYTNKTSSTQTRCILGQMRHLLRQTRRLQHKQDIFYTKKMSSTPTR